MPIAIWVVVFTFVAGVGYIAGTFHTQIIAAIAPVFGVKVFTGELDLSSVQTTYQQLKANYDGEIDDSALVEGANRGLVDAVGDEYTVYLNAQESSDFDADLSGSIGGGVGIELGVRNDYITVLRVLRNNPAEAAGIEEGDIITAVNDESALEWTVQDAVAQIRGDIGTTVKLTVQRGSDSLNFTVTRDEINNPSVYSSVDDGIGIITITRFDSETGQLARQAARDIKNQGAKKVILDLRGNGGGYLTAAQDVAGIWLDRKVVVTEKTNGRVVESLTSASSPILNDIPTVVLVNGSTASASEIVAGALQDYGVATIVGEQSFGKGSVQKLITLPAGAELKVTVAKWYTPNGQNISEEGITPDVTATLTAEDINAGRDPQLEAAKSTLN